MAKSTTAHATHGSSGPEQLGGKATAVQAKGHACARAHTCCSTTSAVCLCQWYLDRQIYQPCPQTLYIRTYIQQLCMVEPAHARTFPCSEILCTRAPKGQSSELLYIAVFNFAYGASTPLYLMGKHGKLKLPPNLPVYNVHSHQHMPYSHTHQYLHVKNTYIHCRFNKLVYMDIVKYLTSAIMSISSESLLTLTQVAAISITCFRIRLTFINICSIVLKKPLQSVCRM